MRSQVVGGGEGEGVTVKRVGSGGSRGPKGGDIQVKRPGGSARMTREFFSDLESRKWTVLPQALEKRSNDLTCPMP